MGNFLCNYPPLSSQKKPNKPHYFTRFHPFLTQKRHRYVRPLVRPLTTILVRPICPPSVCPIHFSTLSGRHKKNSGSMDVPANAAAIIAPFYRPLKPF